MRLVEIIDKINEIRKQHPDVEELYVDFPTDGWYDYDRGLSCVLDVSYRSEFVEDNGTYYCDKEDWMDENYDCFESEEEALKECNTLNWHGVIVMEV